MTATLQDRIYDSQDIVIDAVEGVPQSWIVDLAANTTDVSDPPWTSPGAYGSRTGWLKLAVTYPMTVTISYTSFATENYMGVYSWDGIAAPVELFTGATSTHTISLATGTYLVGFSLPLIANVNVTGAGSWSNQANAVTNAPTGTASGDQLLAFLWLVGKNPASTITPPAGWSLVYNYDYAARPGDSIVFRSSLFKKTSTGSEPSTYSFGLSPSTGYSLAVSAFKGVTGINSVAYNPNGWWAPPTGADGVVETGTVGVTGPNLIVASFQHSINNPGTFSAPVDMQQQIDQENYWIQQSVASTYVSTTGTYGPYSATITPTDVSQFDAAPANGAFLVALDTKTVIEPTIVISHAKRGLLTLGVLSGLAGSVISYDEPFVLGSFLLDSVEPFTIDATAVMASWIEKFSISGPVSLRSAELFDLGETLLLNSDELFSIIGTNDVYLGTGSPASPKLGWRRRT